MEGSLRSSKWTNLNSPSCYRHNLIAATAGIHAR
jgi:hypothetical protein